MLWMNLYYVTVAYSRGRIKIVIIIQYNRYEVKNYEIWSEILLNTTRNSECNNSLDSCRRKSWWIKELHKKYLELSYVQIIYNMQILNWKYDIDVKLQFGKYWVLHCFKSMKMSRIQKDNLQNTMEVWLFQNTQLLNLEINRALATQSGEWRRHKDIRKIGNGHRDVVGYQ